MTRLLMTCGLFAAMAGAVVAQEKKDDEKKDVPKELVPLQGTWKLVRATFDGRESRIVAPDPQFKFEGDVLRDTSGKDGWGIVGTVTVDPKKKPAEFTIERNGKKTLGIYKIEGGKLYWAKSPEKSVRPKTFTDKNVDVEIYEKAKK